MTLNDIKWEGPGSLEDLCTWGIQPAMGMLELLDEKSDFDSDEHTRMLYMEIKSKLESIEEAAYHLMKEAMAAKPRPA